MTTGIIIALSPAAEVKSHHNPSLFAFLIIILPPHLPSPHLKKEITSLYLDPVSITVRLDRKCGSDKHEWHRWVWGMTGAANKQPVLLSHYHFSRLWLPARLRGKSPFPVPRREDGENGKSEADINAVSSRNANALPPRSPRHLPGTWVGRLGAQTGRVNKSARGLNRDEAVIKLRPEAIAREMSGNLTKCPGKEISLRKHTLGGHEIVAEQTLLCLGFLIHYLGCYPLSSSQLNFSRVGNVFIILLLFLFFFGFHLELSVRVIKQDRSVGRSRYLLTFLVRT